MKKVFYALLMGLTFSLSVHAEDNYPDDDIVTTPRTVKVTNTNDRIGFYGLGFYSYDGGENYSLSFGGYQFNGAGLMVNLRSNFKFSDHQNTYNGDFLLNYSLGVYNENNVIILVTPEIGPSFATRDIPNEKGEFKEKFFLDGFVGIKATVAYKKIVLSAGYHIWAPKWKFGKNYKLDGFYAQLGLNI